MNCSHIHQEILHTFSDGIKQSCHEYYLNSWKGSLTLFPNAVDKVVAKMTSSWVEFGKRIFYYG